MESDDKDWRVILTALDGAHEAIKNVFGKNKQTISQSTGSCYGPEIDETYLGSKINTLQELLESRDEMSMKPHKEVFASYAGRIDRWSSQAGKNLG